MADYWIKLYHEILDDPKMGTLPDRLWRRCIELFVLAGRLGHFTFKGELPPTQQLAWALRMPTDELELDLTQIETTGIIKRTVTGWLVVNFAKRQAAVSSTERSQQFRQRNKQQQYYDDATSSQRNVAQIQNQIQIQKKEEEGETEEITSPSSPSFSQAETASAIASFGNNGAQECARLYQRVTGQICIPPNQTSQALQYLQAILDSGEPDIEQGKRMFAQWCGTQGKNGRTYSKLNTAWLGKWLEQLAPSPDGTSKPKYKVTDGVTFEQLQAAFREAHPNG